MKFSKEQQRKKRHNKIRSSISGTAKRPRLSVFRSLSNISAQLIDDTNGKVLCSSDSIKLKKEKGVLLAEKVGLDIAKKALKLKINTCLFDRSGYLYHGRVKALADGARKGGLQF